MIPPMDIKYFMLTCSVLTDMVSAYRILHASHRYKVFYADLFCFNRYGQRIPDRARIP